MPPNHHCLHHSLELMTSSITRLYVIVLWYPQHISKQFSTSTLHLDQLLLITLLAQFHFKHGLFLAWCIKTFLFSLFTLCTFPFDWFVSLNVEVCATSWSSFCLEASWCPQDWFRWLVVPSVDSHIPGLPPLWYWVPAEAIPGLPPLWYWVPAEATTAAGVSFPRTSQHYLAVPVVSSPYWTVGTIPICQHIYSTGTFSILMPARILSPTPSFIAFVRVLNQSCSKKMD